MKKILTLLLVINTLLSYGQDINFSQPYVINSYLNPALSGMLNGFVRVATTYREQGSNNIDRPFSTYAVAADIKYDLSLFSNFSDDIIGVGLYFINDRVSSIDFNTNNIELSLAFHKTLGFRTKQYLSAGFQAGILQRNINFDNLTFEDMFNKVDGYTLPTSEPIVANNFAVGDFSVGLNYYIAPGKNTNFSFGGAFSHFAKPNISFYQNQNLFENTSKLPAKIALHFNSEIKIASFSKIIPRLIFYNQGVYSDLSVGTTFKFSSYEKDDISWHLGLHPHVIKDLDSFAAGPVTCLAGIQYKNFMFGFSYDFVMTHIIKSRKNLNTFELTFSYLGDVGDEGLVCPKF